MRNNNYNHGNGMSILGVTLVVFIILKLLKLINWSWIIVLIPLWIELVIFVGFLIIALLVWLLKL